MKHGSEDDRGGHIRSNIKSRSEPRTNPKMEIISPLELYVHVLYYIYNPIEP